MVTEEEYYDDRIPCRGCEIREDVYEQHDAYGYSTGYWCDNCYESDRYPYRKDRYFTGDTGERLEDDY
jgi:hypothetical protein